MPAAAEGSIEVRLESGAQAPHYLCQVDTTALMNPTTGHEINREAAQPVTAFIVFAGDCRESGA